MRRRTSPPPHRVPAPVSTFAAETELRLDLPCDRDAPAAARARLRGLDRAAGDAILVASELVSNAVLHSGAVARDHLTLHVTVGRERVLISVVDPGRSNGAARPSGRADRSGGFGLHLVEQLCTRWGSDRRDGHRVWAELPVAG
jgi:anti-sigma regulatory factor (Ser/Thr protein kinase)